MSLRLRPMTLVERGVGEPTVSLRALLSSSRHPLAGETNVTATDYARENVDPALAARLRGADLDALLGGAEAGPLGPRGATLFNALFESLVTLGVRVFAQAAEARVGHIRTRNGDREIDLIVERADGRIVAIEVKLAHTISEADVRHLAWLQRRLGPQVLDAIVITTGRHAVRRADGIGVVPAALLGP